MIRTNVVIDEKKLKEAKKAFDIATTKDLIDFALTELLKMHRRKEILTLKGRVKVDLDLDRSRENGLMHLVDTSIWIQFFNDATSPAAQMVERALLDNQVLCINAVIEVEILQGIRDDESYATTKDYLTDFQYFPALTRNYFDKAVDIYRSCRKKGVTVRRSLDCVIAANALIDGLVVMHIDRDFDQIKRAFPRLETLSPPKAR